MLYPKGEGNVMRIITIGFFIGVLLLQQLSVLPDLSGFIIISIFPLLYLHYRLFKYRLLWAIPLGFIYALWVASTVLDARLNTTLEGKDILVQGLVSSIPYRQQKGRRFQLIIQDAAILSNPDEKIGLKGKVRITWYRSSAVVKAGEQWQLVLRLKRPSGFRNAGSFDYEKWLFSQRIIATGYVRKSIYNKRLADAPFYSINALRERVAKAVKAHIHDGDARAIILALAIADRRDVSDEQWSILRQTGTNHLVAISGLHIGLVASFAWLPIGLLGWLSPLLYQRVPARILVATLGAGLAIGYALLAGLTLPTQRALIMVLVALMAIVVRRQYSLTTIYCAALLVVLIFDPLAVLSLGFWLSFLAVGLIIIAFKRRIKQPRLSFIGIQLILSFGMLPLLLGGFGSASLSAPFANLLAIPWVSFVVVPLVLLGILTLSVDFLASFFLHWAGVSIDLLFKGLDYFASPDFMLQLSMLPFHLLVIVFIGMLWLLLPRRFPTRWLGLVLLTPLLMYQPKKLAQGVFEYHLLDVGQGLSSVIFTRHHVLVYDAGPRSRSGFDTGKLVMLPFLQSKGVKSIDTLLISHEDMDHRGGAKAIIENMHVKQVLSSDTESFVEVKKCEVGQSWQWDGVSFEILSPADGLDLNDNNKSCVLRVANKQHSLLLTGDIQKKSERWLLANSKKLPSEVMLIPHHGSKTSSLASFIDAVNPQLALVSAGYRNRFHLPNKEVSQRYVDRGIEILSTIDKGAIRVSFPDSADPIQWQSYRQHARRYWHR
ncbi:MAG TPA: DNA internalization-related competence protein ComEC/Rec2 [Thiotrichaceae bacterium]|nr:DNA internalization-related competence protein ComEC/Rec2 [Thiotrichaceae bacterium]